MNVQNVVEVLRSFQHCTIINGFTGELKIHTIVIKKVTFYILKKNLIHLCYSLFSAASSLLVAIFVGSFLDKKVHKRIIT